MSTRISSAKLSLLVAVSLSAVVLAGCMNASAASGSAAIFVKDDPADEVAHLYVTFSKVQLHQSDHDDDEEDEDERDDDERDEDERDEDDGNESASPSPSPTPSASTQPGHGRVAIDIEVDEDEDDRDEGWITIMEGNTTVDLRAFNGTARAFLGSAEVPVGDYNQIRLTVVSATVVLKDGNESDVKVPSHALRIKGHFTVEEGKETQLTLDFDLDRSLHRTGDGTWMLRPVLRLEGEHRDWPDHDERMKRIRERDDEDRRGRDHDDRDDD